MNVKSMCLCVKLIFYIDVYVLQELSLANLVALTEHTFTETFKCFIIYHLQM